MRHHRVGSRVLVATGMSLGAVGMLLLAQISLTTGYASGILPGLVVMGVGLGLVFGTAMNSATLGVSPGDAGVTSATVNACQQVGGSLGTALLSTLAASAATGFVTSAGARPTPSLLATAAVHGYTTAFAVSAGIFAVGSVVAGLLYAPGVAPVQAAGEPVLAA
jgi:FtsH-binding integral membrane protein